MYVYIVTQFAKYAFCPTLYNYTINWLKEAVNYWQTIPWLSLLAKFGQKTLALCPQSWETDLTEVQLAALRAVAAIFDQLEDETDETMAWGWWISEGDILGLNLGPRIFMDI